MTESRLERVVHLKYVYPACFYPEGDGRVSVVLPDFPLATFGGTLADAMGMAAEAAAGRISVLLECGERLPEPSALSDMRLERADGFASLVYIDYDAYEAAFDEQRQPLISIGDRV